ncbi:MAG: hypothetical protein LCH61_12770 [Proteobacteria bacterium]|nr:hypothetical protein [Pseudomonadota bacterium]
MPYEIPKFDRLNIEAYQQRKTIYEMVGYIMTHASNNESLVIYYLKFLIGTTDANAEIIFYSFNNLASRVELVKRLIHQNLREDLKERTKKIFKRLESLNTTRNELAHCIYDINETGYVIGTYRARFSSSKSQNKFRDYKKFDQARYNELKNCGDSFSELNKLMHQNLQEIEIAMQVTRK